VGIPVDQVLWDEALLWADEAPVEFLISIKARSDECKSNQWNASRADGEGTRRGYVNEANSQKFESAHVDVDKSVRAGRAI
jgi:hypothetical protein